MKNNPEIKPDYILIKMDDRRHWGEKVNNVTTELYSVYAFDRNSRTFCCEITPSYELNFIADDYCEIEGLTEEQREDLSDMVMSCAATTEPVCYMHCSDVERMMKEHPERVRNTTVDLEEDADEDPFDVIREGWSTGSMMF